MSDTPAEPESFPVLPAESPPELPPAPALESAPTEAIPEPLPEASPSRPDVSMNPDNPPNVKSRGRYDANVRLILSRLDDEKRTKAKRRWKFL